MIKFVRQKQKLVSGFGFDLWTLLKNFHTGFIFFQKYSNIYEV